MIPFPLQKDQPCSLKFPTPRGQGDPSPSTSELRGNRFRFSVQHTDCRWTFVVIRNRVNQCIAESLEAHLTVRLMILLSVDQYGTQKMNKSSRRILPDHRALWERASNHSDPGLEREARNVCGGAHLFFASHTAGMNETHALLRSSLYFGKLSHIEKIDVDCFQLLDSTDMMLSYVIG